MLPVSAALLPPFAIVPLIAIWMSITHKLEGGGWIPGTSFVSFGRIFVAAYIVTVVAHIIYGGLIFFFARLARIRSFVAWCSAYSSLPLLVAICFAYTTVEFQDTLVHVLFAAVIGAITWLFIRPLLAIP